MVRGAFVLSVANRNTSSRGRGMKTEAEVEIFVTALRLTRDRRTSDEHRMVDDGERELTSQIGP